MSKYARLPILPADETPEKVEEQIFNKPEPTPELTPPPKKELTPEEQKKQSLAQHLAKCRAKSLETRKKKALEKKANKKPRGRPKKVKVVETETKGVADSTLPQEPIQRTEDPEPEPTPPPTPETIPELPAMTLDYEKLADMVAGRLKPKEKKPDTPPKIEPKPIVNNQQQVGNFLSSYADLIRQQERTKLIEENKQKQKEKLQQQTKNYYKKLPPVSLINSNNEWDNLFNGRR